MPRRAVLSVRFGARHSVLCTVLVAAFAWIAVPSSAVAQPTVGEAIGLATSWLEAHQNPDGSFGDIVPLRDSAAVIEALGSADSSPVAAAAVWMSAQTTETSANNDYLARKIAAFSVLGSSVASDTETLLAAQSADGGFGLAPEHGSDVLDTGLALRAMSGSSVDVAWQKPAAAYLIAAQHADGGWALDVDSESSVLLTAQTVSALADFRDRTDSTLLGLEAALSSGGGWLATRQSESGGFGDTLYETALSYTALKAAEADFNESATVGHLLSQQAADGSFHGNCYDTALSLQALKRADINLAVTSVETSQVAPRQGTVVRLTATVVNTGANLVANAQIAFYDADPTSGAVSLGQILSVGDLEPGERKSVAFNFDTSSAFAGVRVYAKADPDDHVFETDEDDNVASLDLALRAALTAPALFAPADGAASGSRTPMLSWLAPAGETGDLSYIVQLDRSAAFDSAYLKTHVVTAAPATPITYAVPDSLSDGAWYWRVAASDASLLGPFAASRSLVVDAIRPSLTSVTRSPALFSPNGDGVKDSTQLTYDVSEDVSVNVLVLNQTGGVVRHLEQDTARTRGPHALTWDGTGDGGSPVSDGPYTIRITARDAAGNESTAQTSVTVDTTAPDLGQLTASATTFSPNGDGAFETVTFNYTRAADATITVRVLDQTRCVIRAEVVRTSSWTWNGKNAYNVFVEDGSYQVTFVATDDAGNSSSEAAATVVVKTAPRVGRLQITPNPASPGAPVSLALRIDDDATATVTLAGATHGLSDPDGDGTFTAEITAPATTGNYPITLSVRDSLANVKTITSYALVCTSHVVTGPVWVQDTYEDFQGTQTYPGNLSTRDGTDIDVRPGSVQLSSKGWTFKTPVPQANFSGATCLGPGGKVYVFGGFYIWGVQERPVGATQVYDPATDAWETKTPAPSYRLDHRAVLAPDGKIYVMGGADAAGPSTPYSSTEPTGVVEAYDPATDTWERDTNHGGTLAPMPTGRAVFGATLGPDGRIYCFGGYSGSMQDGGSCDAVEVYDPLANTWTTLPPMPRKECCFAAATDDGTIYLLEGEYRRNAPPGQESTQTSIPDVWAYSLASGTWQAKTQSPLAREEAAAAKALDGQIYIFGGELPYGTTTRNYAYNPATDSWSVKNDMLREVASTNGVADLQGRLYAIGGIDRGGYTSYTRDYNQCFDSTFETSGTFISMKKSFGYEQTAAFGAITWDAEVPEGTTLTLSTRTSNDGVNWSDWSEEYVASGAAITSPDGVYIQYRATFTTTDPLSTPRLDRVQIVYNLSPHAPATYGATAKTKTPTLSWAYGGDPESDPIVYELQLDTSSDFSSPSAKTFDGIALPLSLYPSFTIPAGQGLADGVWQHRVRASDGNSTGAWSNVSPLTIDTAVPTVTITSVAPSVLAVRGTVNATSTISYSISETCTVRVKVLGWGGSDYTWQRKSWDFFGVAPGTHGVEWDGLDSNGQTVADGTYLVKIDVSDAAGNQPAAATDYIVVRRAPSLGTALWASSDPSDPQAPCVLNVTVGGNATDVRATIGGQVKHLFDDDHDGVYTGAVLSPNVADRFTLDSVAALDEVTSNEAVRTDFLLDSSGYVGPPAWTQTLAADFDQGTKVGVAAVGKDSLGLGAHTWTSVGATLSVARYAMASAAAGDKIYAFGGYSTTYQNRAESIDPATGMRQVLALMPTARSYCAAATAPDGRVLVFGGSGATGTLKTVEAYDPATDVWQSLAAMPVARTGAAAVAIGGKIYLIGGTGSADPNCVQAYDPATGAWTTKARMPLVVQYMATCEADGKIYVFGGFGSSGRTATVQVYDPASDTWSLRRSLPVAWYAHAAARASDGKVYIFGGGLSDIYDSRCYAYNPATDTYEEKDHPALHRTNAAGVALDGRVYSLGGYVYVRYGASYVTNTIECYDPHHTGTYTSPVKDAGQMCDWTKIGWTGLAPDGTGLTLQTRSSVNSQSWSAWSSAVQSGGGLASPAGRYVQYKASLETSEPGVTPTLSDVTIGYRAQVEAPVISTPVAATPADGDTIFDRAPSLGWLNSSGGLVRNYEVQLDTAATFDSPSARTYAGIAELPGGSTLHVPSAAPLGDGVWYWRVRATDGLARSAWSSSASFAVIGAPDLEAQPSSITVSPDIEDGDVATVTATVRNLGAPCGVFEVAFFDGEPGQGSRIGADVKIEGLDYQEARELRIAFDSLGKAGAHQIHVVADIDNRVTESSETNNDAAAALTVAPHDLGVSVGLDRSTYTAAEEVSVTVSATNDGRRAHDLAACVDVLDAAGNLVESVATTDLPALAPGDARSIEATWNTGAFYAGDYIARARLLEGGRTLASAQTAFRIAADVSIDSRVTVDRLTYSAHQNVAVTSKVTNKNRNSIFENLLVVTEVSAPDSSTVLREETTVAALNLDETKLVANRWDTGDSAPGAYLVTERVLAPGGELLSSSETSFTIASTADNGAGLSSELTATPGLVHQGGPVTLVFDIANNGNADLAALPTSLLVVDPETTSVVKTIESTIAVAKNTLVSTTETLDTAELPRVEGHASRTFLAVLRTELGGRQLTLAHATFRVLPIRLSASIGADAPAYDRNQTVELLVHVTNETTDYPLDAAALTLEIVGPDGAPVAAETTALASMAYGEIGQRLFEWETATRAPGLYTARIKATYRGMELATAQTSFTIRSTAETGAGLVGSLIPLAAEVAHGDRYTATYNLTNAGNADVIDLPLAVLVVDEQTGEVVKTLTDTVSVATGASTSGSLTLDTGELVEPVGETGTRYSLRLEVSPPAGTIALSSGSLTVVAGVRVAVSLEPTIVPRVLVWAESEANRALAADALAELGGFGKIVTTDSEFLAELRSGIYSTYVILDTTKPLTNHFDEELAAKAYSGATVIGSRWANMDNLKNMGLFGTKFEGYLADESRQILLSETSVTSGGLVTASGSMQRLTPQSATVLATSGTWPAATANSYGQGRAILFAFNLAHVQGSSAPGLLVDAIRGAPANLGPPDALGPSTLALEIENKGVPITCNATLTAQGAMICQAPGATGQSQSAASFSLPLDRGQTATYLILLRLPDSIGPATVTVQMSALRGTSVQELPSLTHILVASRDRDALTQAALDEVSALCPSTTRDRQRKDRVIKTLTDLKTNPPTTWSGSELAIQELVKAISELEQISVDTHQATVRTSEVLTYWQARWSQ